jgi:RNA recognition motif-containing protein
VASHSGMPRRDPHRKLRHACWKGDVKLAKSMLKRGADVEGTDADFFTPTLIAARWGQLELLQLLVEKHNASLLAKTREGDTAYNLAVGYGHSDLAEYLHGRGCSTLPNPMQAEAVAGGAERPDSSDGGQISGEEESRTIWVGGIPAELAADATNATLTKMFTKFGELAAISTRQKPGERRSWAFITFADRAAAQAALAGADTAVTPSSRRSEGVALQVQASQVSQHLFVNEQKGTTGQLATVWRRRTPPAEDIKRIREEVRAKYNELRLESEREAGRREVEVAPGLDTPVPVASSKEVEIAPGMEGTASGSSTAETEVNEMLGQPCFPVTQSKGRGAARKYKLGVGTMGLALFDGPVPVATWPYKLVVSANATESKKRGRELHVEVNAGKKHKRMVFGTEYAEELNGLIQDRLTDLLSAMKRDGVQDQARPFSTTRQDEWLQIDGVGVPFEVASFGAQKSALDSCRVIGAGATGVFDETAMAGCGLAMRRQGKYDFSFVDVIERAQDAGAVACILVNYCDEFVVPKDKWAESRITIPVLTLPLTIGGGMLARHGADNISFSFDTSGGDASTLGDVAAQAAADDDVESTIGQGHEDQHEDADTVDAPLAQREQQPSAEGARDSSERKTLWVGGIPAAMLDEDADSVLTQIFEHHGTIASITLRPKPGTDKSWAFVTYAEERDAAACATAAASDPSLFIYGRAEVALQVQPSQVGEHLEKNRQRGTQGALADVWQRQMEQEAEWMGSLLGGLNRDVHYQAAKDYIAQTLGLRPEELEDELEDQELEELLLASWDSAQEYADADADGAEAVSDSVGLGLPPSSAAPRPSAASDAGLEPEPEPQPEPAALTLLSRGVSADFMLTSQGVSCDV